MNTFAANTLLILGDSLSAGYQLPADTIWANRIKQQWQELENPINVINASISGDTVAQGYARLPEQLKQHQPKWVLIELGANDGLRGYQPAQIKQQLSELITMIEAHNAIPILMQIYVPPNYGKRYSDAFIAIYPTLAKERQISVIPFFLADVITKPQWMLADGIHPNADAQPFIAQWMSQHLLPVLK